MPVRLRGLGVRVRVRVGVRVRARVRGHETTLGVEGGGVSWVRVRARA